VLHCTSLEGLASIEHPRLLGPFVSCEEKMFCECGSPNSPVPALSYIAHERKIYFFDDKNLKCLHGQLSLLSDSSQESCCSIFQLKCVIMINRMINILAYMKASIKHILNKRLVDKTNRSGY
jgi:hypothetical protein